MERQRKRGDSARGSHRRKLAREGKLKDRGSKKDIRRSDRDRESEGQTQQAEELQQLQ